MTKFQQMIADNSSATLKRRAKTIATQARVAQETIVNTLVNKLTDLEMKIDNLTDFAPQTTDSLNPSSKDWNPSKWAEELQRTKFEYWKTTKELEIAKATLEEFFTDSEA